MGEKGQQQLYYCLLEAALLPHTEETNSYEKAAQVSKQKRLLMTVLMSFNEDFCTVVKWSHHMCPPSEHYSSLEQQQRKNKESRIVQTSKKKKEQK